MLTWLTPRSRTRGGLQACGKSRCRSGSPSTPTECRRGPSGAAPASRRHWSPDSTRFRTRCRAVISTPSESCRSTRRTSRPRSRAKAPMCFRLGCIGTTILRRHRRIRDPPAGRGRSGPVLLGPGPDEDQAAKAIRGIQILRRDPGGRWVELDSPDVAGLDDVVQLGAGDALPVDPYGRLAAPDPNGVPAGRGGADRDARHAPEQRTRARGRDAADVRELQKAGERPPLLPVIVELSKPPDRIGVDAHFLQLSWSGRDDDLEEGCWGGSAQEHVDGALLVAEAADADGEATGGNVPQLKPPLDVGGDRSPQRSAFDHGDLRLGYGRTGRILDGAGHLIGRCRRRWGPGGVLRGNR